MKKITWLFLAAASIFASCQKQEGFTYEGKPVSFSASTSNINTKTAYQGSTQNGKEAILWENGDAFTVYSNEASIAGSSRKWANYKVTVSDGVATAVNPVSDELLWGRGLHHFYALYPAGDITGNTVNAAISASQDLTESSPGVFAPNLSQEGYMAAAADGNPGDPTVLLNFKPLFTTLEFVVGPGYDVDAVVSGFRLVVSEESRTVLSGKFSATLSAQADPEVSIDYSVATGEIKVNFGESVTVNKGESLKFTILALPAELTDLVAVFTLDGVERSFPLVDQNGNPIVIAAGQKARITALGILDPAVIRPSFSVAIEGQDVADFNLSVPGPNGTVGLLPGVFKAGDKKVRLSKGNLQAVLENGVITKWQFAEHQWETASDITHIENGTGVIDQFLTSTDAPLNNWGIHLGFADGVLPPNWYASDDLDDVYQFFGNNYWGTVVPQWENPDFKAAFGSGWTMLNVSVDYCELLKLFMTLDHQEDAGHGSTTDYYNSHCTPATIDGISGIILFPIGYIQPDGISLELPEYIIGGAQGTYGFSPACNNTLTVAQWNELESAGAAFFPCGQYGVQSSGVIEEGNLIPSANTFQLEIRSGSFFPCSHVGMHGMIRLVQIIE